ncbi:AAA domain-containing protein [Halosimplex amylolyticum]|uniref:AAA domain-containing protein n=1 Tax=Halosimplex amylolyticum TaxID=3396616 RepID=UPI003F550EA2
MTKAQRTPVSPSAIAQFYKLQQCPMYLYHRYVDENLGSISDVSLSPLLAATGEAFEAGQLRQLLDADVYSIGPADEDHRFDEHWSGDAETDIERFRTAIDELVTGDSTKPVVFFQPRIRGTIGAWPVRGDADVVIASPDTSVSSPRTVEVRVVELKSSSSVKTHHQLQAAIYSLLLESMLEETNVNVTASIVSQEPERKDLAALVTSTGILDLRRVGTFDLDTRQNDIQLLLESGGALDSELLDGDEMRESGDPPTYRIDARCDDCAKQSKCIAYAVTNHELSLLGLTEGVQESLIELGIEELNDLATLYDWPTESQNRRATSYVDPRPNDPELVTRVLRETEISNLRDTAQIAHRFLRQIDPEYEAQWEQQAEQAGPWGDYLIGTGRNLPDDDPPDNFNPDYPRKSLVRVYPYVQYDFVRNRVVLLAAKVTSSRHEGDSDDGVFIVSQPDGLPNLNDERKDQEERRLIESFFEKLSTAVNEVRPDLGEEGYSDTEGFLHVYPYGNSQRHTLIDAVKRHPDSEAAQAIRTLLGYREDIDQMGVSVLRDEFRDRHAFRYPGLGVVQTAAQFYSHNSDLDWEGPRDQSETALKRVFALGFFETTVSYDSMGSRILLDFEGGLKIASDHMNDEYPIVGRNQDTLPLEYLYATDEFDLLKPDLADDTEMRTQIERYRHHTGADSPRITLGDIEDVVHAICDAYEHIERAVRDKDATMTKQPIELKNLRQNTLGVSELQSTSLEYQELEFGANRRKLESKYRTPLSQRTTSGRAIPFEVTEPPEEGDDETEGRMWLRGSILRSLGDDSQNGIQSDTPLSLEEGSFVVMTALKRNEDGTLTEDVTSPDQIANQVLGRLTDVDTGAGTVRVSFLGAQNRSREKFKPNHVGWTSDEDDRFERQYVEEGMRFVLDPALDDFVAHRAHVALQNASQNDVHNRLVNLYDDEIADALRRDSPQFDPDDVRSFLEQFNRVMPESTNHDQTLFVSQTDHTVAALQGPPGTGKTRYASAPAILARAEAASGTFSGVATAHSHNAVDEVARAVADAQQRLAEANVLEDALLVRIQPGARSDDLPDNIREYRAYDDREELQEIFEKYVLANDAPGPLILFTTPVTLRNFVNGVRWSIDDDADSVEEFMADGRSRLFDFTLVDEASMMDLPLLFLVGAFLGRDKQLMLIGDHRQMQPIQAHDWESEDRQTIEENTPAVSALDFVRFLRGDKDSNFEQFDREPPTWPEKDAVLPMDQLKLTYRLPPAMARFETDLFYHRDNITLESAGSAETIPDVKDGNLSPWVNAALDPETRITVILHDDNVYTKNSPVEAYLASKVLDPLPLVADEPEHDELSAGVVVPFRLMRRRMQNCIDLTVDTVERFQGGERDVMALAMTAGNQGYVNQVSEFLLDANRFNVGASRMKRKLFIVVSKSLFRAVSSDPEKYEQQKAWKQLYQNLIADQEPVETTQLSGSDVEGLGDRKVSVQVYTGYQD